MILETLRGAPPSRRHEMLVRFIEDQMLELLDWPANQRPELSRGFVAIGFDSLKSVDLQLRMQEALHFVSRSGDDFRQPTVAALAARLLDSGLLPLDEPASPQGNKPPGRR